MEANDPVVEEAKEGLQALGQEGPVWGLRFYPVGDRDERILKQKGNLASFVLWQLCKIQICKDDTKSLTERSHDLGHEWKITFIL
jgi:hypothetical protein